MKKSICIIWLMVAITAFAQQLPDNHFENWSDKFKGDAQLADWHGSNVNQLGSKFTFLFQKPGRTGFCAYVADRAIGIPKLNLGATGPGYMSLGVPWQYLKGLSLNSATAGTEGGIDRVKNKKIKCIQQIHFIFSVLSSSPSFEIR